MRTLYGPVRVSALAVRPELHLPVFRIVRTEYPDDPVFLNSLKSHYELSEPPRRVERDSTLIHMGISVYVKAEDAHGTARIWPKIGGYVAQFDLRAGFGFNYAHTGAHGHLTLWADPVKLSQTLVDIRSVEL